MRFRASYVADVRSCSMRPRKKKTELSPARKTRRVHDQDSLSVFMVTIRDEAENPDWLVGAY